MARDIQYVETKSGRLAYSVSGDGSGVPLLVANRFRGTIDDWDPDFIAALGRRRKVIVFDSAGIGRSEGEVPTSIPGMAQIVSEFASAIGLSEADLLGWSLGGLVAQQTALDYPTLVRRLIVAGSSPGGITDGPQQDPRVREVMSRGANSAEDFLFLFFPETETARFAGYAYLKRLGSIGDRGPLVNAKAVMNQFKAFGEWGGVRGRLAELTKPVLVANGQHDVMIPAYRSYVLAQEVADGKLVLYPDAGHAFLFQYIDDFVAEIDRFLA